MIKACILLLASTIKAKTRAISIHDTCIFIHHQWHSFISFLFKTMWIHATTLFPPATIITCQCPSTSFFFSYTIIPCIQGSTMTLFSLTIPITCYQTIPFCKTSSFVSFTFVNHFRTLSVVNDRKSL